MYLLQDPSFATGSVHVGRQIPIVRPKVLFAESPHIITRASGQQHRAPPAPALGPCPPSPSLLPSPFAQPSGPPR